MKYEITSRNVELTPKLMLHSITNKRNKTQNSTQMKLIETLMIRALLSRKI